MSATAVPASTSYTPGNASLNTIISEAAAFVQAKATDSEVKSVAKAAVNSGIQLINTRRWVKIFNVWTITLVADDADYSLPADYKEPIVLLRLNPSSKRDGRLRFIPYQSFFMEYDSATSSSNPTIYTVDYKQRLLELNVGVASDFLSSWPELKHYYHRRVPKMTTMASTTGLPPEFDEWLVTRAAVRLARIRDPRKVAAIRDEERELWGALKRDDNDTMGDWE